MASQQSLGDIAPPIGHSSRPPTPPSTHNTSPVPPPAAPIPPPAAPIPPAPPAALVQLPRNISPVPPPTALIPPTLPAALVQPPRDTSPVLPPAALIPPALPTALIQPPVPATLIPPPQSAILIPQRPSRPRPPLAALVPSPPALIQPPAPPVQPPTALVQLPALIQPPAVLVPPAPLIQESASQVHLEDVPEVAKETFGAVFNVASMWGASWAECITAFIRFERGHGFTTRDFRLPASKLRPSQIKTWFGHTRAIKGAAWDTFGSGDGIEFGEVWRAWWLDIQPAGRGLDESGRLVQTGVFDWKRVDKPGTNGLFLILVGLVWWKMRLGINVDVSGWEGAVAEVAWVLDQLAKDVPSQVTQFVKRKAISSDDEPSNKKSRYVSFGPMRLLLISVCRTSIDVSSDGQARVRLPSRRALGLL